MLGDFTYHNPTKLIFGKNALSGLAGELAGYGKRVLLVYGGGSIKKNGIYDRVVAILEEAGKEGTRGPRLHAQPHGGETLRGVRAGARG